MYVTVCIHYGNSDLANERVPTQQQQQEQKTGDYTVYTLLAT